MPSNNCYWFVYSWLNNEDWDSYKTRDDLNLWKPILKSPTYDIIEETVDYIKDVFNNDYRWNLFIIEILDNKGISQHVAFIDNKFKIYDQDWPDWIIHTWNIMLNELLYKYENVLWGDIQYKIYGIDEKNEQNVYNFLKKLNE